EKRFFLRGRKRKAITGASIDFDELASEFILLLENQPGKVSRVFQLGDDGAFDVDVETFENTRHEIVRERSFFRRVTQKHSDDGAHVVLDLDDEHFLLIADKNGAAAVRRQDPAYLDG